MPVFATCANRTPRLGIPPGEMLRCVSVADINSAPFAVQLEADQFFAVEGLSAFGGGAVELGLDALVAELRIDAVAVEARADAAVFRGYHCEADMRCGSGADECDHKDLP